MNLTAIKKGSRILGTATHLAVGISTPQRQEGISSHLKSFFYACHILLWRTDYRHFRVVATLVAIVLTCFRFAATHSTSAVNLKITRGLS